MAAARQYTPARRMIMQGVMWLILGATVAVAAIITVHRRNLVDVKLTRSLTVGHLNVMLPGSWKINQSADSLSPMLVTATEPAGNEDEGRRTIRIIREPLEARETPTEYVQLRLATEGKDVQLDGDAESIQIAGSAGLLQSAVMAHRIQSLQDMVKGMQIDKLIVAGAVPASGRGVAVTLEGSGEPESSDVDLVRRIAQSIELADEPKVSDEKQITIGEGILVKVPDGFDAIENTDALRTARQLRGNDAEDWRAIDLVPIVLSDKDGAEAVSTMLGCYDDSFSGSDPHRDSNGVWQIEDTHQEGNPSRAYVTAKDGQGFIAILKGGKDDQWMDGAWDAIAGGIQWPAQNSINQLIEAGTEEAKRVTDAGLAKLHLDDSNQNDLWWMVYLDRPERPLGWLHLERSTSGGRFESRGRVPDRWMVQNIYNWRGSVDLKSSYRAENDSTITPLSGLQAIDSEKIKHSVDATLNKGKLELSTRGGDVGDRDLTYSLPGNYVPGGWLPDILATVSDGPMIVRVDSVFDGTAQNTDLLTVIVRPTSPASQPSHSEKGAVPLRAVSVEISGEGERSIWYLRPDGSLDSMDEAESIHTVRQDVSDIATAFSRDPQMKTQ